MKIVSASWQMSVQARNANELTELLRFAQEHYIDVAMTSMNPSDAKAIPLPLRVNLSYTLAEDPDDVVDSLGALHQLRLLTGQMGARDTETPHSS